MKNHGIVISSAVILLFVAATVGWSDTAADWQQCDQAVQSKDFSSAIGTCNNIISDNPNSADAVEAMFKIGDIYRDSGSIEQAIQEYAQIVSRHPQYALRANLQIGYTYLIQGDYAKAISALNTGITSAPATTPKDDYDLKRMKCHLVEAYCHAGQLDEAIACYQKMITDYPDDAASNKLDLAKCYMSKGDYNDAVTILQSVKTHYPARLADAQLQISECYQKTERYSDAISMLNASIASGTVTGDVLKEMKYRLADCYRGIKDFDNAINQYRALAAAYPDEAGACLLTVGQIYMDKGDYQAAITELDGVRRHYTDKSVEALLSIGDCYKATKRYPAAIASFRSVVSATSTGPLHDDYSLLIARCKLGECYRESKDWSDAIALYQKLITDYPNDAGSYTFDLANCYAGEGDYGKAIDTCDSVASDYPKMAKNALLRIEELLGEQGKYDEELAHLNQLYTEHPDFRDEILMRRAIVRSDQKDEFVEAISDLQEIVTNHPDSSQVPYAKARIIGLTLHGLGDRSSARQLALDFIAQNPDYEQMMFVKGDIATSYFDERNYAEAAKWFDETLQYSDPGNYHPYTLYLMTYCYQATGDKVKAKETATRLISNYPSDCWAIMAHATYATLLGGLGDE